MDPKNDEFWTKIEVQKVPAPGGSNRPQKVTQNADMKSDDFQTLQTLVELDFQI